MEKQADSDYAKEVKYRADMLDQREREKEQKRLSEKVGYYKDITAQMKTDKQRKKYGILMTEHERRVNDKNIEAYRECNSKEIDAHGVPALGQNYQHIQQKYIQ